MLSQVGIGTEPKNGRPAKFGLSQGATTDTMVPGNYPEQVPFWRGHFEQPHGSRLEGQHCRCEQLLESPDR
jgi:hypothetical protein